MLNTKQESQEAMEFVSIGELVPGDHLLRKVLKAIDFEFIRGRVKELYCCDNGRPAIDPVVLFKMIFIGYFFGIRSERQLEREIQVNVAYRWFLGFGLRDRVPDASTLSQNRRRRFSENTVYQDIFDEIVLQAVDLGLVDGKILYTDSTHLKANANKNKFEEKEVKRSTRKYLEALEEEVSADRMVHGKKALKEKDPEEDKRTIKVSTVDPESGYMIRDGKPKGFFYLDHRTVDSKHAIITDSHATPANVHDSIPYLDRLDRQQKRFGFEVEAVGLDAGYFTPGICKGLEDRNIYGVMGYRRPNHIKGYFYKREFEYDHERDSYWCPCGQEILYKTTNRGGYREYISDAKQCRKCEYLGQCTKSANCRKVITRHVWQESKERIDEHRLSEYGKAIYARRKETVERSFADAKQLHGHRYARMRGLKKVLEQCLLAAACQNMKKIALIIARRLNTPPDWPAEVAMPVFNSILRILNFIFHSQNFLRQQILTNS